MEVFNDVLLEKQVCWLLQNNSSLVARLFKARYYPHSSVLEAELGWTELCLEKPFESQNRDFLGVEVDG